jgi:DNA-binding LytR/AlgR family response regulator
MTIKALIAEDEPLLAENMRCELAQLWPGLDICAVVGDGYAALAAIERHRPQVLFLDVQMPGLDGLEVARLAGTGRLIVFVTAFEQFAVGAFTEGAVDYLVKPLDPARLARAVMRVKARLEHAPLDPLQTGMAPGQAGALAPLRWFTVQQGRGLQVIAADDICFLRADHKYVAVVTADAEALITTPLKEMLSRLDPESFWQVHRGYVVNIKAVRSISRGLAGSLSLHLKERAEVLPVSASNAHLFKQW